MDIVLAVVPWRIIWSLTMNKKEKSGILIAMSMGILYASPPRFPTSYLISTLYADLD
jgi:hypothetical protein